MLRSALPFSPSSTNLACYNLPIRRNFCARQRASQNTCISMATATMTNLSPAQVVQDLNQQYEKVGVITHRYDLTNTLNGYAQILHMYGLGCCNRHTRPLRTTFGQRRWTSRYTVQACQGRQSHTASFLIGQTCARVTAFTIDAVNRATAVLLWPRQRQTMITFWAMPKTWRLCAKHCKTHSCRHSSGRRWKSCRKPSYATSQKTPKQLQ